MEIVEALGIPGAEPVVALTVVLCWCASIFLSLLDTMGGSQASVWIPMS